MKTQRQSWGQAVTALAFVAVGGTACAPTEAIQVRLQQAGTLGMSADGKTLYVADQDNGGVAIVDPNALQGAAGFVKTGDHPERVVVRGNNIFVSNRHSRTVTHIDLKTQQIVRQISVGAEPMGMEVSDDNETLYVAQATQQSVLAIAIATGTVKWHAELGDEVHAVAVIPGGRLYVPGYKSGQMHVLDQESGAPVSNFIFVQPAPVPLTNFEGTPPARVPTQVEDIHVTAKGLVYMPHSQSAEVLVDPTPMIPANVTAYYVVPGRYGTGPAVTPGYTTIQTNGDRLLGGTDPMPPPITIPTHEFSGPKAAVVDASGKFLYSVNYNSNNVAVIATDRVVPATGLTTADTTVPPEVLEWVSVGHGPNGIVIGADQKSAYVYNSFDHTIDVLGSDGASVVSIRTIGQIEPFDTLTPAQIHGRQLFNDASNPLITVPSTGGIACASCHPGGREDGMTWHFAEGLRNTPVLVGKQLTKTAPYHWDGAFDTFYGINHVLKDRMGGSGLTEQDFNDMLEYLANEPMPDNPNRTADGALTPQQQAGKDLFEGKGNCVSCHNGEVFTDNASYDVGTKFTTISIENLERNPLITGEERVAWTPNTPSLLGIFASAPYLSNGSAPTLKDRVKNDMNGKHGHTAGWSEEEYDALVSYLKTL